MLFTGTYELTIDNKNRLSIPAGVRSAMDPEKDGTRFYLVPGSRRGTLGLYGDRYYEAYSEQYHASLPPAQEKEDFEDLFYSMAAVLDVDRQGRVVLPQRLLEFGGIAGPVTLTGARDHLVLWNRKDHEAFLAENQQRYQDLLRRAQQQAQRGG
jgi:MraZ protein